MTIPAEFNRRAISPIELESRGLTSGTGEIIRYRAINRWDPDDEFDEWAKPVATLTSEAELIVGVTNEQLANCRPSSVVMGEFFTFLKSLQQC